MPEFTVRVFQVQVLNGYADVSMTGGAPDQAADVVLAAVQGDPDDWADHRRYRLPDGRLVELDSEDCVVGSRVYCQVLDDHRRIVGLYGDLSLCDFTEGAPEARVEPDLRAQLADLREAADRRRELNGGFPLHGIGSLFDHLDDLDAVASAGLQLRPEENATVRDVLDDAILGTNSNEKAELLAAALRKLPRG